MANVLMPHQLTAAAFLAARGPALLWDDMGLGKSASTIAGADQAGCHKILVCCPAAVRPHWAREFARWQTVHRTIDLVEGNPKTPPAGGVTIVSHAALSTLSTVAVLQRGAPYDLIIVDEIHGMKTHDSRRTRSLLDASDGAWRWAWRIWGLTGTPMVNSAGDLWPMLAGPFHHGQSWWEFVCKFTELKPGFSGPTPSGIKNATDLANILRPHVLRRTLDSVGIELPSLTVEQVTIGIDPGALATAMGGLADWTPQRLQMALDANDDIRDEALSRVRHALGLAKIISTANYVTELMDQGCGPIVVFFQHTEVRRQLYEILSGLGGFKVSWIDGKITPAQLTAAESWFQAGELDILLAQTQAAGQGLTLHRANTCVLSELPWTSVAVQQAIKRTHRIGQTRPCVAHILRANACWLEDILSSVVSRKQRASDNLLNLLTSTN